LLPLRQGRLDYCAQIKDTVEKLFGEAKNSQSALTVFFYLFDFIEVGKRVF
jgi:hypothetical protein